MESEKQTIILSGQARLPKNLSAEEVIQIIIEMNPDTDEIIDVSCSPCSSVIDKFLRKLMTGKSMESGPADLLEAIENRFHHRSQKAILTALRDLFREYREYRERTPLVSGGQPNDFRS